MKDQTKPRLPDDGRARDDVTADSAMPYDGAAQRRPASRSSCPSQGNNVAGGKELLRIMLSTEAATNFAKTKLAPTIVKGTRARRTASGRRRWCRRPRCWRRRARTSSPSTSSTSTARTRTSWSSGTAFLAGDSSVEELTSRAAGDHRQGPRGRLDHQDRGGVTSSVAPMTTAAVARRRSRSPRGGGRRRRKLTFDHVSFMVVFLGLPVALFLVFVVWPFVQALYYAMTDWSGFTADFNFIGFDNYTSLSHDDIFMKAVRNNILLAIVVPLVTIVDRLDVRHDDHDRRRRSRGNLRGLRELQLLPRRLVLPLRRPGHRHRPDLERRSTTRRAACSTASSPGSGSTSSTVLRLAR